MFHDAHRSCFLYNTSTAEVVDRAIRFFIVTCKRSSSWQQAHADWMVFFPVRGCLNILTLKNQSKSKGRSRSKSSRRDCLEITGSNKMKAGFPIVSIPPQFKL